MRRRAWRPVRAALVLLLAAGCGPPDGPEAAPVEGAGLTGNEQPRNCLFIVLDAFSASHASFLGYDRNTTPYLDGLAAQGVVFEAANSQCSNTLGSTLSYLTGTYLPQPADRGARYAVEPGDYTLAQAFAAKGFKTAGYSENPFVLARLGFDQGFETFQFFPPMLPPEPPGKLRARDLASTAALLDAAKAWLEANKGSPWFCYLHLLRPHDPYHAPEPFVSRYSGEPYRVPPQRRTERSIRRNQQLGRMDPSPEDVQYVVDLYDGNIAYADDLLRGLMELLESDPDLGRTLVVVTSDHGEEFMEHGRFGHNETVYEEVLHVPLIFHSVSTGLIAPRRIGTPVELIDLFPTLAETFGLHAPGPLPGHSLLPVLRGGAEPAERATFGQSMSASRLSVRQGGRKLILYKVPESTRFVARELYDLASDPGEHDNLWTPTSEEPALMRLVEDYLERHFTPRAAATPGFSDEQEDTLRSLGYVQ